MSAPKSLIINSAYRVPTRWWDDDRGTLKQVEGRRPAGYEIFDTRNNTRRTEILELVNRIRERVDVWRSASYPGVTSTTRRLLEHWNDAEVRSGEKKQFYFCQLEAVETLIWHVEALPEYKQGIHIPGDGGPWERICSKMATGAGKTTVMGMVIAWQVLNALEYPKRNKDFSQAVFVVAPGLTVKERLQVLYPGNPANVYDEFRICPSEALRQKLNRAEILVENWHTLMPLQEPDRSVVKKGAESDEAFTRRVLGKLAGFKDIVVINDEAHHAYRKPAELKISKKVAEEKGIDLEEATRWIEGLDRLHKTRRIQRCFDLTATPFAPTGRTNTDEGLFEWIVSDFGLNDAIEAGLVKTPRIVVRDAAGRDARTLKPKLYHLYRDSSVSEDLNRRGAEPHEALPNLVQDAYTLLGADWREARADWEKAGHTSPPVMLTVCNRTETAARIEHFFAAGDIHWEELRERTRLLRVDSKVLEKAEVGESAGSDKDYEAQLKEIVEAVDLPPDRKQRLLELKKEQLLREIVDNVGKRGTAGQDLQKVISVAMLSEGWDAKNVTHIMGLRAFTSQLLCEQVIGRGLRRVSYETDPETGFFKPEYVNVFGVPLSVFQDVDDGGDPPPPPKPSTQIESLSERNAFEIRWPNVLRIDTVVRPTLVVNWDNVEPFEIDADRSTTWAELASSIGEAVAADATKEVSLEKLPEEFRLQRLIFHAAQKAAGEMLHGFKGNPQYLMYQLVRLVEEFFHSDKVVIPSIYHRDDEQKRLLIALNRNELVQYLLQHITEQNIERLEPVFDEERPLGSTREMRTWYTTKPAIRTTKSQISHVVADSGWETKSADLLERSDKVAAYAKNDHLGFQVHYLWKGSRRRYVPDFLIRFKSGKMLVLEIKGEDSEQNKAKRAALDLWVQAVNQHSGFGEWGAAVAFSLGDVAGIIPR